MTDLFDLYLSHRAMLASRFGEDAAQEVGIQILTHPPEIVDPEFLRRWCIVVASHARGGARRQIKKELLTDSGEVPECVVDPAPALEARLMLRSLPAAVIELALKAEGSKRAAHGVVMTSTERVQIHRYRKKHRKGVLISPTDSPQLNS